MTLSNILDFLQIAEKESELMVMHFYSKKFLRYKIGMKRTTISLLQIALVCIIPIVPQNNLRR